MRLLRRKEFDEKKVRLQVWTRVIHEDGEGFEYRRDISEMEYRDLPERAVHITSRNGEYALIDMEPRYPPYMGEVKRDDHGKLAARHNFFDAQGYFVYAVDDRIKAAEQSVGIMKKERKLDMKTLITVVAVVAVVGLVVWRFML